MRLSEETYAQFWATTRLSEDTVREIAATTATHSGTFDFSHGVFDYSQIALVGQHERGTMLQVVTGLRRPLLTFLVAVEQERRKTSLAVGVRGNRALKDTRPLFRYVPIARLAGVVGYWRYLGLLADAIYEQDAQAEFSSTEV